MNTCRNAFFIAVTSVVSQTALGLGLGEITLHSYVNEPLSAHVELLDVGALQPEDIRVRLATQEDFDRLGVDRAYFLTSIQFEVLLEQGSPRILLSTGEVLVEPYLDFLLEARWPSGRLLREYTVLVDLPPAPSSSPVNISNTTIQAVDAAAERETPATSAAERVSVNREYGRDVEPVPTAGGSYLVTREDTLWKIASAAALPGVSVEQTMLATVAKNPRAFAGGNINGLKAGYVLALPTEADLSMGVSDAISAVKSQNSDWASGVTSQPVLRVVADSDLEADDGSTEDEAPWTNATGPLVGDQLNEEVAEASMPVANTPGESAYAGQTEEDFTAEDYATEESSESSGRDNVSPGSLAAIEAQVAELSGQVGNLRELVAIKDKQIAELQASLAAKQPSAPAPAPFVLSSLLYLAGGAALGALALLLGLRFRRGAGSPEPGLEDGNTEPRMSPAPVAEARSAADASKAPLGNSPDGAIHEALAEAEIYISYGRHQQALNLLAAAAEKAVGADAAEAYCKMIDIALANDRREEAAAWLTEVEAMGTPEQVAAASNALQEAAATLPDLGELVEPAARPYTDARQMAPAAEQPFDMQPEELQPEEAQQAKEELQLAGDDGTEHLTTLSQEPLAQEPPAREPLIIDAGALGDSESVDASPASLDFELGELSAEAGSSHTPWGANTPAKLPPELAAVLGTDVVPPPEGLTESQAETLVYANEVDPLDAKLDLARAYIDMGDEEGARPVLEEVVANGDLRQQAEARELLVHID
jgi:pilus assembly protein FimV